MKKIDNIEAIRTTTMFLLDEKIEQEFDNRITSEVKRYQEVMADIDQESRLRSFIVGNPDSIEMLETLLGISGERMKRVVSMIRVSKGYTFDSEWTESRLQKELALDESLLNEYCELFFKGREIEKYRLCVPKFILDDFCINKDTINRLTNTDILVKLFKKKNDTAYTTKYSAFYLNKVLTEVNRIIQPLGFDIVQGNIDGVGDNLQHYRYGDKYVIITSNYSLTTSQGQTKYAERISKIYRNIRGDNKKILINLLDGAGWVGRSSDFKKIHSNCHYFLNLKTITDIEIITKEFFNI